MDAVELPYPVDVAPASICKLMGSDGFGRAVAQLKEVGHCDLDRVVSNGWCSSSHGDKDEAITINASESPFQEKRAAIGCFRRTDQLPSFSSEELSQSPFSRNRKAFLHRAPQESNLQSRAGKVSQSVGKCSKRARIIQAEETSRITDASEIRDSSDKYLAKSLSLDGNQSGKQKNAATKRGEKRSSKFPMKSKFDCFPMKAGSAASNVSSTSNSLGFYGLKTDIQDFSKLIDDLSLDDILEGTYRCPSVSKEKGKKVANPNDNVMQSVREISTMLLPLRPGKFQNLSELDNPRDQTIASPFLSCMAVEGGGVDDDSRDPSTTDAASSLHENNNESTLYTPKDLLKRLSLPPPKDLESLLLDASKPISSSKSASDVRPGKQVAKRGGMPSFPWSHAYNGHFRSNSDAAKLPLGRGSSCPGKWARMKSPTSLLGEPSSCFTSLDSITYDKNLVPESEVAAKGSSRVPLEHNAEMEDQQQADRSCGVLAAARTLCDMPASSSGKMKWRKRPPLKAVKARFKPDSSGHKNDVTNPDKILSPKKPKLSPTERCFSKVPESWSAPSKSSRTFPSRFHSIGSSSSSIMNQRSDNHQKPRKPVLPDWNRGGRDGFR